MAWTDMSTAPRNVSIWLFLPGTGWKESPEGTPTDITNEVVKGGWDITRGAWTRIGVNAMTVYPSLWSDAPIDGAPPDPPVLPLP